MDILVENVACRISSQIFLEEMNYTTSMSQTSSFVKKLASNERPTREAALDSLKKFLSSKSAKKMQLLELEKLWKGLYFSMWFCDRPRAQERLAESLGSLYSEVVLKEQFANFLEAFWIIIIKEWPNIDQWRIDKYYLLIRRVLRHSFKFLSIHNWDKKVLAQFISVLERTVLSGEKSISAALPYHLCDIYIDELEKIMFHDLKDLQEEVDSLDKDDKEYIAKYQELTKQKFQIVEDVPLVELVEPFTKLSKEALSKTLREKCKQDVLDDSRLNDWNVFESDEEEEEDEDAEDEWKGF